eukprot:CAMPEP_0114317454 /NCGR_PEP_ID=MMETSP0059-20121206/23885_1 /TAXON_ID=36894 /ORGANISM="Pyramimonas parkeae, Strain CCMP726" /LENGTH=34 /DNA_ID= /DNA_START= /DNA_END= /DNA_ORIENTATION=
MSGEGCLLEEVGGALATDALEVGDEGGAGLGPLG